MAWFDVYDSTRPMKIDKGYGIISDKDVTLKADGDVSAVNLKL